MQETLLTPFLLVHNHDFQVAETPIRCHRLHKTCAASPAAQRRRPKRSNVSSRSARLEEKLDDLVSILRAQHSTVDSGQSDDDGDDSDNGGFNFDDTSPSSTTIAPTVASGDVYTDQPSPVEAVDCLRRFRDDLIVCMVHLPDVLLSVMPMLTLICCYSHSHLLSTSLPTYHHFSCDRSSPSCG